MQLTPDTDVLEKIDDIAQALRASVDERDRDNTFARAEFFELGARGVFRLALGEDRGSLDRLCALIHGLALRSSDLGFVASLCAHLCAIFALREFGHRSTRGLLESLVAGDSLGAIANSEPNAGTDLMGLQTSSRRQGHAFILDGTKWSVTNVSEAEVILVSATARAERAQRPIDHFVVESSISGVKTSRIDDLIGLRTSVTGNLTLSNACVSEHARLGSEGDGVTIFQHQFDHERLLTATLYLGALDTALERGVQRAQVERGGQQPLVIELMLEDGDAITLAAEPGVLADAGIREREVPCHRSTQPDEIVDPRCLHAAYRRLDHEVVDRPLRAFSARGGRDKDHLGFRHIRHAPLRAIEDKRVSLSPRACLQPHQVCARVWLAVGDGAERVSGHQ